MYCVAGMFTGVNADGGYAEYMRTSERALVVLPQEIDPIDVAPYADAGLTAYRAVRKASKILQPGQTVVVLGAGGGLGHIGVQLLNEMTPARVVAVDKSELGRDLAAKVGAEAVFGVEDAAAGVAELTGGAGANLVLDFVVEGDTPQQAVSMLGQGGTYSIVGYGAQLGLATMELILKEATVVSTMVGNYADLSELMALVVRDRVKLETKRYALEDAVSALDDLDNGRVRGRAVLTPNAAS
jgi:NAD+-dependent secondary alcohol dehydrogenase Adh1